MSATNRGGLRHAYDFYVTPAWCVRLLLYYVEPPGTDWLDAGAGDGAIVRAARSHPMAEACEARYFAVEKEASHEASLRRLVGMHVTIGDFLAGEGPDCVDAVIMNPPYSLATEFVAEARRRASWVAALLRLNWLASERRAAYLAANMPDVYVLSNRPSFTGDGHTDGTEYAWMVWPSREPRTSGIVRVLLPVTASERRGDCGRTNSEGTPC